MNYKLILNFIVAVLAVIITLLFFASLYEYYNIAILKNIEDYPFGSEGPVAGIEYYENATKYSYAMLQISLVSLLSSLFIWLGIFKERILFILIGIVFMILSFVLPNFDLFILQ